MEVIRDNEGKVTKVIITEKEYAETHKDFKGKHDGKRTWIAPFDVSEMTMQLTEGKDLEIVDDPDEKKFQCYYIGCDGNKPVRHNLWLTRLNKLIPAIGDNKHCETPLWYETTDDGILLYAQLSDTVAVLAIGYCEIYKRQIELMTTTDAGFDAQCQEHIKELSEDLVERTPEKMAQCRENIKRYYEEEKDNREYELSKVRMMQNYTKVLLDGAWITAPAIRAYEEIGSPYLPVLQEMRRLAMEKRKQQHEQYLEERKQREAEEKRKAAEAEAKEQQRLTGEAEKFKNGEAIAGEDVVELCRRYGIKVHLRTVHNLQQVIVNINGKTQQCQYYKVNGRKPVLDGCYKTARELYEYLQTHEVA